MPASYRILTNRNLVYIVFEGSLTSSDVLQMRAAQVVDPAYRAGLVELIDMRGTEAVEFGVLGMMNIIRQYQDLFDRYGYPLCMVILAPGDLGYGMARMFDSLTSEDIRFKPILTQTEQAAATELARAGIHEARQVLKEL